MPWDPGDAIEYRHVKGGKVWWRTPARVIEDSDERTVLWWPAGTAYERVVADGRLDHLRVLASGQWDLEPAEWTGGDALHVVLAGAPFSLWPFRTADHQMVGWYCNLQAPLVRTEVGFDTDDWTLDVVAATDLSSWAYKDEDELEEGARIGLYDPDQVATIRAAGERAVALIETGAPLLAAWAAWQPDRSWPTPTL
jgi:hypothetical protein